MKKTLFAMSILLSLSACKSTSVSESTPLHNDDAIPSWVLQPTSVEGLAASSCVPWSGSLSVDRAQAITNARADLSQQLQVKASVLDKLYQRKVTSDKRSNVGSTFEQVSKQVADQQLVGSIPKHVAFARIDNQKQLCVFVEMPKAKQAFNQLVEASGKQLDPTSKAALYEEFRSQKAMKELEKELDNAKY